MTERDSNKVTELAEELIHVLDNETKQREEQMVKRDEEQARRKSA